MDLNPNYIANLRFYAKQAQIKGWHTEGRIIGPDVISATLNEIANAVEMNQVLRIGAGKERGNEAIRSD